MEPVPDALLDRRSAQELADLRRRAYGPDADIDADPVALARLAELEALGRPVAPPIETPPESEAPPDSAGEEPLTRPSFTTEVREPEPDVVRGTSTATPRRRGPRWVWIAVACVVAVVAAVASYSFFSAPQPDATLFPSSDGTAELPTLLEDGGFLEYIEVDQDDFVEYDSFQGIVPWVAPRNIGGSCVVLVLGEDAIGYGCGLADLGPIADLVVDLTDDRWRGFDLREGSIIRFTLRGDVLDVGVAEPPAATPAVTD